MSRNPKQSHIGVFGWCMFGRHNMCKVTLENGKKCVCDCEDHGKDFVPAVIDTPMHRMLMKAGEDNGYTMTGFGEKGDTVEVTEATEETIEELEDKRAKS